jgi:hypothetical protein
MPEPQLSLEDAYNLLLSWSSTLMTRARDMKCEVVSGLDSATPTPSDAPSRASEALLAFRKVRIAQEQVERAVKQVENAIRLSGK